MWEVRVICGEGVRVVWGSEGDVGRVRVMWQRSGRGARVVWGRSEGDVGRVRVVWQRSGRGARVVWGRSEGDVGRVRVVWQRSGGRVRVNNAHGRHPMFIQFLGQSSTARN